jgi:TolB protein
MTGAGSDDPWAIHVLHRNGTLVRLSPPGVYDIAPTWSPDGSRIAFESHSDGSEIWVMNADGTNRVRLTHSQMMKHSWPGFPAWSPDGEWIAFSWSNTSTYALRDAGIHVIKPDGTDLARLTPSWVLADAGRPAWSPDGSRLAFLSSDGNPGNLDIHFVNTNGTGLTRIPVDVFAGNLAWSPDGKFLAFNNDCPPAGECSLAIWLVHIADGSLTPTNAGWGFAPAWVR